MGPIQRYPFGLLETLAIKGAPVPSNLNETVVPTFDTLQFYGNQQRQLLQATSAALARGTTIQAGNSLQSWVVIYGANVELTKTATLTNAAASIFASGSFASQTLAAEAWTTATPAADGKWRLAWVAPYPMVFGPNTSFFANLDASTDANLAVSIAFSIGLLA